jgi:hypothetical protein
MQANDRLASVLTAISSDREGDVDGAGGEDGRAGKAQAYPPADLSRHAKLSVDRRRSLV